MTALEEIKKGATQEEIAAAWSAWQSRHGGKLGPGPAFVEAINAALAWRLPTLESLQRENEELRKDKDHIAAEKAGIAKNAHNNVDYWKSQAEAAEAEVKRLRGELSFYSCDGSTRDCISGQEDANSVTCGFRARTALASTGGEHHAE